MQVPTNDGLGAEKVVGADRAGRAVLQHVKERGQPRDVLGGLRGDVAHRLVIAAGSEPALDEVVQADPRRVSRRREIEHGRRQSAARVGGERCVEQCRDPPAEALDRRHGRGRGPIGAGALRARRPRDQEAGNEAGAARQRAGALEEAAQRLGLGHQPEGQAPVAQLERGLAAAVDGDRATVPQHVEQRQVAQDRVVAHAVRPEYGARLGRQHAAARPAGGERVRERFGRGVGVEQARHGDGGRRFARQRVELAFLLRGVLRAAALVLDRIENAGLLSLEGGKRGVARGEVRGYRHRSAALPIAQRGAEDRVAGGLALAGVGHRKQVQRHRPGELVVAAHVDESLRGHRQRRQRRARDQRHRRLHEGLRLAYRVAH